MQKKIVLVFVLILIGLSLPTLMNVYEDSQEYKTLPSPAIPANSVYSENIEVPVYDSPTPQYSYYGFETGLQGWIDGGSDAGWSSSRSHGNDQNNNNNGGSYSVLIRDDSDSSQITNTFDFTTLNNVTISWWAYYNSIESNDYFTVECDGNDVFTFYADGQENQWIQQAVTIENTDCTFDDSVEIQFEAEFSSNYDRVFVDAINMLGDHPDPINPEIVSMGSNLPQYTYDQEVIVNVTVNDLTELIHKNLTLTYPSGRVRYYNLTHLSGSEYYVKLGFMTEKGHYDYYVNVTDSYNNSASQTGGSFNRIVTGDLGFEMYSDNGTVPEMGVDILSNDSGVIDARITMNESKGFSSLDIVGLDLNQPGVSLRLVQETPDEGKNGLTDTFAIDPEGLNLTYINITFVATSDILMKCTDYDFDTLTCGEGGYKVIMRDLIPGKTYTVTIDAVDPGFGQTTSPAGLQEIEISVAHPNPAGKDKNGVYAVIVHNPTNLPVDVTEIFIITNATNNFNGIIQGAGTSLPTTGWSVAADKASVGWAGTVTVEPFQQQQFYINIDSNKENIPYIVDYYATVNGTNHSQTGLESIAFNANYPFPVLMYNYTDQAGGLGVEGMEYTAAQYVNQVAIVNITLAEHSDKEVIPQGSNVTVDIPISFTAPKFIASDHFQVLEESASQIIVNLTVDLQEQSVGVASFWFNTTMPSQGGLHLINASIQGLTLDDGEGFYQMTSFANMGFNVLDNINPVIVPLSPTNGQRREIGNINFTANLTDNTELSNGSFSIYYPNDTLLNTTLFWVDETNATIIGFDFNIDVAGEYKWVWNVTNIYALETTTGNQTVQVTNSTLVIDDSADASYAFINEQVNFTANYSDIGSEIGAATCLISFNDSINQTMVGSPSTLINYWNFDEGSGTTFASQVTGVNGDFGGTMASNQWTTGVIGSSAFTDGGNSGAGAANEWLDTNYGFAFSQQDSFSFCMWMSTTDTASGSDTIDFGSQTGANRFSNQRPGGNWGWIMSQGGNAQATTTLTTDGSWNQYCLVRNVDDDSFQGWYNGALIDNATDTTTGNLNLNTADLYFGARNLVDTGGARDSVDISVDEVSFWNKSLTSSDVSYLYNSGSARTYTETLSLDAGSVYTYDRTFSQPGNYTWNVSCTAENYTARFESQFVTVYYNDTTAPVLNATYPTNNSFINDGNVNITINITDNETRLVNASGGVYYSNGTNIVNQSYDWSSENFLTTIIGIPLVLADGIYNIFFNSTDFLGNIGELFSQFTVDSTTPQVLVFSPENGSYHNTTTVLVNFTATGTNIDTLWYNNGTTNITFGGDSVISCYQESATVADQSGTDGSCSQSYTGAYYEPLLSNIATIDGNYLTSNLFSGLATPLVMQYALPSVTIVGAEWRVKRELQFNGTFETNFTIPVTCLDSSFLNVSVEKNATGYTYKCSNGATESILEIDPGVNDYTLFEEGIYWEYTQEPSLTDGVYNYTFYANNSAGTEAINESTFTVDTTAPFIEIVTPVNASLQASTTVFVNITAIDATTNVSSIVFFDGSVNTTYTAPVNHEFPEGNTTMIAWAFDFLGNVNTTESVVNVPVDFSIDECKNITFGGHYTLGGNLSISSNASCLTVLTDDVSLDCQGGSVQAIDTAIKVQEGASNITISNCQINNATTGRVGIDSSYAATILNGNTIYVGDNGYAGLLAGNDTAVSGFNNSFIVNSTDGFAYFREGTANSQFTFFMFTSNITNYRSSNWVGGGFVYTENATFITPHGSIFSQVAAFIDYNALGNLTTSDLNIAPLSAYVNSTKFPEFNVTSDIEFFNTGFTSGTLFADLNDSGILVPCPGTVCSNINFSTGDTTFQVSRFSNFTAAATPELNITTPRGSVDYYKHGEPLNMSWEIIGNATLVSCSYEYGGNVSSEVNDCFQESYDVSNQTGLDGSCNQLYNGTFDNTGLISSQSNFYDGNYNTQGGWSGGSLGEYVQTKYSKPQSNVTAAIWRLKGSISNNATVFTQDFELPQECVDSTVVTVGIAFVSAAPSNKTGKAFCRLDNSTEIELLVMQDFTGDTFFNFNYYEDSMLWNATGVSNVYNVSSTPPTNITYQEGANNLTLSCTTTAFGTLTNSTSWYFKLIEYDYTYDTPVFEGTSNTIYLNISVNSTTAISDAFIIYNNVSTLASVTSTGGDFYNVSATVVAPDIVSTTEVPFYFNLTLTDGTVIETSEQNQTVAPLGIDDCTVNNFSIMNLSIHNERTLELINATIEVTFDVKANESAVVETYSIMFNDTSNATICSSVNLTSQSLLYSSEIRYYKFGSNTSNYVFAPEFYHIQNDATSNLPQVIPLYDLNSTESTEFTISYRDDNYVARDNVLLQIQRKYVDEGIFRTVEIPITSDGGKAVGHFDVNNYKYRIVATQNGEVLNIFDNVEIRCENELSGICEIDLVGRAKPLEVDFFSNQTDFSYTASQTDSNVTVSYIIPTGATENIRIEMVQYNQFLPNGNQTICNQTIISSSGQTTCTINATVSASRVEIVVFKDSILQGRMTALFEENFREVSGLTNYFIGFIFIIVAAGMFISSPAMSVVVTVLSFIFLGFIFLVRGSSVTLIVGSIAWLLVALIVVISKLVKKSEA